jgi:hypothetical protein
MSKPLPRHDPVTLPEKCYRYATPVIVGRWHSNLEAALSSAVAAGQALDKDGAVQLHDFVKIEEQQASLCMRECNLF